MTGEGLVKQLNEEGHRESVDRELPIKPTPPPSRGEGLVADLSDPTLNERVNRELPIEPTPPVESTTSLSSED